MGSCSDFSGVKSHACSVAYNLLSPERHEKTLMHQRQCCISSCQMSDVTGSIMLYLVHDAGYSRYHQRETGYVIEEWYKNCYLMACDVTVLLQSWGAHTVQKVDSERYTVTVCPVCLICHLFQMHVFSWKLFNSCNTYVKAIVWWEVPTVLAESHRYNVSKASRTSFTSWHCSKLNPICLTPERGKTKRMKMPVFDPKQHVPHTWKNPVELVSPLTLGKYR